MNWNIIEGRWDQAKSDIKAQWAKITDDDISAIGARKDKLVGMVKERYGVAQDEAERQIDGWIAAFDRKASKHS